MVHVSGVHIQHAANDDADFQHLAVSAVGEAFNNVVLHAYAGREGTIAIEIEPRQQAMIVRLIDDGASFDPSVVPLPELASLPEGGMGLYIMRAAMDEVAYEAGPPNVLRLTKRRSSEREREGAQENERESDSGDRLAVLGLERDTDGAGPAEERSSGLVSVVPDDPRAHRMRTQAHASAKSGLRPKTVPPPAHVAGDPRRA